MEQIKEFLTNHQNIHHSMVHMDLYKKAHLIVAAIRLLEYQNTNSPSIEKVCQMLSFSVEQGNLIVRRLKDLGILGITEGAFGLGLFIQDHLAIENIPRDEQEEKLAHELEKFQKAQKDRLKKIESLKAEQDIKKKNLFAEIEQKLKKDLEKKKTTEPS